MATRAEATPLLSERVRRLKEDQVNNPQVLDAERCMFLLETYRETEGEPTIVRRAKLFEKVLLNKTIYIDDNIFVGSQAKQTQAVYPYPEMACRWMRREAGDYCGVKGRLGDTGAEDMALLQEAVDYWYDRNAYNRTHEFFRETTGIDAKRFQKTRVWADGGGYPQGSTSMNYGKVLNKGLKGIIKEIEEQVASLPVDNIEVINKKYFYQSMLRCLDAVIKWAGRYADLARKMAKKEKDPARKAELDKIAETCDWVPANPARSFHEALQSFWFIHCAAWIETAPVAIAPGRMPQYLCPFYKKDKEEGKITEEEAIELLEMVFLKIMEGAYFLGGVVHSQGQGHTGNIITVGGYTPDGKDATNEVDWLILEAQRRIQLPQPTLHMMYHDKMSEDFLIKAVEVVRDTGLGQPAFFGADVAMKRNLFHYPGITMEEARDIAQAGCIQTIIQGASAATWESSPNMAKYIELALDNGMDPVSGEQLGPETGDAEKFESFEDLFDAYKAQINYFIPMQRRFHNILFAIEAEIFPTPFQSSLIDGCIEGGKDVMNGGSKYRAMGSNPSTGIDAANSLAAVKKLVFDDKKITMKELKDALKANFEGNGYDRVMKMCLDAPKFGNDDPYVDSITRDIYDHYEKVHQQMNDWTDRHSVPHAYSITNHFNFGRAVGALPSGRKAGVPLTDATVSATPGTDIQGPTALAKSAATALDTIKYGSNHFNMKFHPSALQTRDGCKKLLSLIKTYMDMGGSHVQFNCVSRETLEKAQRDPDAHKDLVVRVAGFSAFFVQLDAGVQDEIIKRTELSFD